MTGAALTLRDPGFGTAIQDAGRLGYRGFGVPLSGALDPMAMAGANVLVGNALDAPVLEIRLAGPTLDLTAGPAARLALVGEGRLERQDAEGARHPLEANASFTLRAGERLRIGAVRGTAYLAVAGGFGVTRALGSFSTYARAGLGGIHGRDLQAGDEIACAAVDPAQEERRQSAPPPLGEGPIRVMPGPQDDHFTPEAFATLTQATYTLSPASDRMGLRLEGARLAHSGKGADILSDGVVPGAIQVPANGAPIILLADAQTLGGYAKIATVIRADLPRLAHLRPGESLRFAIVDRAGAEAARRVRAEAFERWCAGIEAWRAPGFLDIVKLYQTNLIAGVTAGHEE